ncbi:reactive intermediate/imine deaminase [Plantactinospora sp. BC1]|nr:reactive intermediate/imine deaminase [Plantactinospora sp. BC1]
MIDVVLSVGDPPADHGHIMGVVEFGSRAPAPHLDAGYPTVAVATCDPPGIHVREIWTSTSEVSAGRRDDIVYSSDGTHLFGALRLPRSDRYRDATRSAYRQLLALISDLDYPHLVRMWNYIADINRPNHRGLEIYRDFCQGRAEGFDDAGTAISARLPAATGVGAHDGGVVVYFLAERTGAALHFENPRQVPAHQYPRTYGPRSPSFARATLLPASKRLFLSGTASIIGHRSVSLGHLEGQCYTTLENIRILLKEVSEKSGGTVDLDSFRLIKGYVRHGPDASYLHQRLREVVGPRVPIEIFTVDICRSELLLEIEGVLDMRFPDHHGDA